MVNRAHFLPLVERARRLPALAAAFVYPCDRDSLQLALSSAFTGTLAPVLVGPEARIRELAGHAGIDIAQLPIDDTADDPRASALRSADLARAGTVAALVQGSLGKDELLGPVAAPDSGLRGLRRLSHASFLDLPGQPRGMLLADAELNIAPTLAAKRDILHNTVELAHALGVVAPKVALLAAIGSVSPALPSTADAAALQAMAVQGIFGDAIVDGPLTPDSALSAAAARANGCQSAIAGQADILVVPGMESGATAAAHADRADRRARRRARAGSRPADRRPRAHRYARGADGFLRAGLAAGGAPRAGAPGRRPRGSLGARGRARHPRRRLTRGVPPGMPARCRRRRRRDYFWRTQSMK